MDLHFLIEIHPEDGFLGGEIRFRISGFQNLNLDFPIKCNQSHYSSKNLKSLSVSLKKKKMFKCQLVKYYLKRKILKITCHKLPVPTVFERSRCTCHYMVDTVHIIVYHE